MKKLPILSLVTGTIGLIVTGCKSTSANTTAYNAATTTASAATIAVQTYDQFAKAGKTTVAENQQVAGMYNQYQLSFALVCDAGAAWASSLTNSTSTNSTSYANAFATATAAATASESDLVALITSFETTNTVTNATTNK